MKTTILILTIFLSNLYSPVTQTGSISGKITDAISGIGIDNVSITLYKDGVQVASGKTSSGGLYLFSGLGTGTYTIKTSCPGYTIYKSKPIKLSEGQKLTHNAGLIQALQIVQDTLPEIVEREEVSYDCKNKLSAPAGCTGYGSVDDYSYVEFNTESYDVINENNFKEAVGNPLSTFSIDVDKASYANVRRFLTGSQKPVKDAVRIEEMINYFDYTYPQPENGDPFSVTMEVAKCPWNEKHDVLLIGLKGENVMTEKIPNGNFVFLIDVSGSMSAQNKLPLLIQAFKYLVGNLRDNDHVSIVVYAGAAGCVLESTPGSEKEKIIAALDQLQAGGSTAGGEGIKLAYKIAKENFIPGGNNRVILATDGDFNIGASSDAEMVRLIEEKRDGGVFLSILGLGMGNYKDSKMEKIADAGNGNYFYIDNLMEAKKVFGTELWGTLYTIAKDVKIQVEFNPSKVKAYRLIGYENRLLNKEDFNDDKKDAGEIGSGHTVTALYELIPAGSDENVGLVDPLLYQQTKVVNSSDISTVKLRYKNPDENESKLIVCKVNESDRKKSMSENFTFACSVAEFGMILRESEHKANASFTQVLALAKAGKGTDKDGYRSDFIRMVEMAEMLYQ